MLLGIKFLILRVCVEESGPLYTELLIMSHTDDQLTFISSHIRMPFTDSFTSGGRLRSMVLHTNPRPLSSNSVFMK